MDFSKLRGSKIETLVSTRKEAEKKSRNYGSGERRVDFLQLEEGLNVLRLCPPHDPNQPNYQPIRTTYLEVDVSMIGEDGKEINGKTERKKKRIFISTIHGNDKILKDPVELYIEYVYKRANDEFSDKDAKAKFLNPITGFRDKKGNWNSGIKPSTNYIFYAFKDGVLGRIELYPQILKKMEELNISEDSSDIIEVDIFSDPISGCSLLVDFDKSAKPGEKYKVSKKSFDFTKYLKKANGDEKLAFQLFSEDKEKEKLTQAQLEEWWGKEPLEKIYKNVYSMRDFDLAINGLRIFDQTHGFNLFENDEFISELEKIQATVPEKEESEAEKMKEGKDIEETFNNHAAKQTASTPVSTYTASTTNNHADWNKIKCRKKIEAYILENYSGEEFYPEGLPLEVAQKWCDLIDKEEELPFEEYRASLANAQKNDFENESKQESAPTVETNSTIPSIDELNKKAAEIDIQIGATESQAEKIRKLREKSGALKLK